MAVRLVVWVCVQCGAYWTTHLDDCPIRDHWGNVFCTDGCRSRYHADLADVPDPAGLLNARAGESA